MKSNRTALVIIAVALAAGVAFAPLAIRGALRCYALHKVLRLPEAQARLAVKPSRRTLTGQVHVHPINLGYATFDTGSTNPISIETTSSGASVLLTNRDVSLSFLPPFSPGKSTNLISAKVSAREARVHPQTLARMQEWEANPMAAEIAIEETQILPLSQILFMSKDDFPLYSMRVALKAGNHYGSREVQFFESPDAKGIVRIGETATDSRFAAVFLASQDGTKNVGLFLKVPETASNDLSASLDPILRSFRFTTERVDDREAVKTLIRGAGIQQRREDAENAGGSPSGRANAE